MSFQLLLQNGGKLDIPNLPETVLHRLNNVCKEGREGLKVWQYNTKHQSLDRTEQTRQKENEMEEAKEEDEKTEVGMNFFLLKCRSCLIG